MALEISETNIANAAQWLEIKAAVRARVRIDPLQRYCAKTGQPLGLQDEQPFIEALEFCEAGLIEQALENSQLGHAPHWHNTDGKALDALAYYDASGFIVYCLAQYSRAWFQPPKVSRADTAEKAVEFYWAKARAYEIVRRMEAQAQTELANELVKGLSLEREVLDAMHRKLPADCRAPDTLAKTARLGLLVPVIRKAVDDTCNSLSESLSAARNGPSNILATETSKRAKRETELSLAIASILNPAKQSKPPLDLAARFARFANQPLSSEAAQSLDALADMEIDLPDIFSDTATMRKMSSAEYMEHAKAKLAESEARFDKAKQDQLAAGSGISILNRTMPNMKPSEPLARATVSNSILNRLK